MIEESRWRVKKLALCFGTLITCSLGETRAHMAWDLVQFDTSSGEDWVYPELLSFRTGLLRIVLVSALVRLESLWECKMDGL